MKDREEIANKSRANIKYCNSMSVIRGLWHHNRYINGLEKS